MGGGKVRYNLEFKHDISPTESSLGLPVFHIRLSALTAHAVFIDHPDTTPVTAQDSIRKVIRTGIEVLLLGSLGQSAAAPATEPAEGRCFLHTLRTFLRR
jgi:hypothetical protein